MQWWAMYVTTAFMGSNNLNKRTNAAPSIATNVVLVGSMTYVMGFQGYIS